MQYFYLKKQNTNEKLYAGYFKSKKHCLEDAVTRNIDLTAIDLSNENLENANLDNAIMPLANLRNANLSGANMSEAILTSALFHNAELYNTCLCDSDLSGADFRYASFGATLITNANLTATLFSTLSCFDLDFSSAKSMHGCAFEDHKGLKHTMSMQPIILKGVLTSPIVILDQSVKIGMKAFPKAILPGLLNLIPPFGTGHARQPAHLKQTN